MGLLVDVLRIVEHPVYSFFVLSCFSGWIIKGIVVSHSVFILIYIYIYILRRYEIV